MPCVASCTVCAISTQCTKGSSRHAAAEPLSQPAQHRAVPSAASAVRAQCAGEALEALAFGNSRRSIALSSERSGELIGGSGGSSGASPPIEKTYSPCSRPSASSCDGCRPGADGSIRATAAACNRGSFDSAACASASFRMWMAWKSAVTSLPRAYSSSQRPPGWSSAQSPRSYQWPSIRSGRASSALTTSGRAGARNSEGDATANRAAAARAAPGSRACRRGWWTKATARGARGKRIRLVARRSTRTH